MKNRQRRIAALLLACVMTCVPAVQSFAETSYDVTMGIESQVLFPKDAVTGITGPVQVNGEETALEQEGTWTNTSDAKVYAANLQDDGTLQISEVGYVLDVENGTSKEKDKEDGAGRHYQFGDWEKPDKSLDRAYYAKDAVVALKADEPADGMEFKQWVTDTDGVSFADPANPETTVTMPDKKVTVRAEYQEKQVEAVPEEPADTQEDSGAEDPNGTEAPAENQADPSGEEAPAEDPDVLVNPENPEEVPVPQEDAAENGEAPFDIGITDSNADTDETAAAEYTLTVNSGTSDRQTYHAGDTVTVKADDRSGEGYEFSGWYVDSMNAELAEILQTETTFTMPEADVILSATYTEKAEEDTSEADLSDAQAQTESSAVEETPAAESEEKQTDAVQTETSSTESEEKQTDAVQTETSSAEPEEKQTDAVQTETAAAESEEKQTETQVQTEDVPEIAETETEAVKYEVTVGNSGIGGGEYAAGETVTIEAPEQNDENQLFEAWTTDNTDLSLADANQEVTTFVMPSEDVSVTPLYAAPRTITIDANTTISPAIEELEKLNNAGITVTVNAADLSAEGKTFTGWTGTATKDGAPIDLIFADATMMMTTFVLPDSDSLTITANYTEAPETYKVTVSNGLINGTSTEAIFEAGAEITVTADPSSSGQEFSHWTINDGSFDIGDAAYDETIHLTVADQDLNIRAEYEGVKYAVTVVDGSCDYEECVSGTKVTVTADEAPAGYEFDSWSVDSGNTSLADAYSNITTFVMPADDVTLTANYKEIAYKVSVENGTTAQQYYREGETVTVKSSYPASGRVFSKWESTSGNVSFADASRWQTTFKMPASDVTVRATYKDGPSTNDNVILDLVAGGQYTVGDTIKFTASGAGMSNSNPNPGDYRYRPTGYQIGNVNGTLQSPYSVSMAINAAGEYTLKTVYAKDVYDGNSWIADGTTDSKAVTFRVVTKAAGVATGDETPIAAVIAIAAVSCIVFIILLVVYLRRRRK